MIRTIVVRVTVEGKCLRAYGAVLRRSRSAAVPRSRIPALSDRVAARRAGAWPTPGPVIPGSDEVGLYAVAPGQADELERRFREFSPRLPQRVLESGAYTRSAGA